MRLWDVETARPLWRAPVLLGRPAAQSEDGRRLCLLTFERALEVWDLQEDRRLAGSGLGERKGLWALPAGCLALTWEGTAALLGEDGALRRLHAERLHGPVRHLLLQGERLHAATELGDSAALELGVFHRSWCGLLEEVWREVPVVWEEGRPVLREPPAEHACAAR